MFAVNPQGFKSIDDIRKAFSTEEECLEELEKIRWNGDVVSPFDETSKVYKCKENRYRCRNTGKYFNAKTYTIFHNSKVPLLKWFEAIWIISSSVRITVMDLSRQLGVTPKTAWLMQKRILKYISRNNISTQSNDQMALTDWLNQLK